MNNRPGKPYHIFNIFLFCILFLFLFPNPTLSATYKLRPKDLLIADFEYQANYLGGKMGSYGAVKGSGYTSEVAYGGNKSYKLVFAKGVLWEPEYEKDSDRADSGMKKMKSIQQVGKAKRINWASFMMNLGRVVDEKTVPVKIEPLDISRYRYLLFWVRGKRGGERFKVYFRDANAKNYEPQVKINPNILVTTEWRLVKINLKRIGLRIDLKKVVQIGIGFGKDDGNKFGNILYIDDFILVK